MITLNKLNNLENMFPMKIIKYISIDVKTIKDNNGISEMIKNTTLGYITTKDNNSVNHSIYIFKDESNLNTLLKYLNEHHIDYNINRYVYRIKTFLNELFNEYSYTSNINV